MNRFNFSWDIKKAETNIKKHKVSFEEAETAFFDPNGREFYDPNHSELEENRFLFLGISNKLRLLLICHCYLEEEKVIRLISARKATKKESKFYSERK